MVDKWHVDVVESNINSSDHNYIRFSILDNSSSTKRSFRDINKTDWNKFRKLLQRTMRENSAHFASIDNEDKLDSTAEILTASIMKAYYNSNDLIYISNTIKRPH